MAASVAEVVVLVVVLVVAAANRGIMQKLLQPDLFGVRECRARNTVASTGSYNLKTGVWT